MAAITLGFSSLRAAVLCSAVVATTTLGVEASTRFQPHRAVYDLAMIDTSNRAGIDGVTGRIVYELTGSPCEGYTSRYRYYTDMRIGGKLLTNDQRSTTFESADGKRFDFLSQYFLNGQREQDLHGSASKTNDGIQVTLKKPDERDVALGPAMFINAHLSKIIQSAKAGETILTATVYDGSDEGDELVETTTIIGKHQNSTAQGLGESEDAWQLPPKLSGMIGGSTVTSICVLP